MRRLITLRLWGSSQSPSRSGGGQGGVRGQDQVVATSSLGYEARPTGLEAALFEPGNIGGPIGVAPVHRRTKPTVFGTRPGSRSPRREQIPPRLEPASDLLE